MVYFYKVSQPGGELIGFARSADLRYIKNNGKLKEFALFVILSVGGLGLNQLILWIGVNFTTVYYLIIKIFAMVIVPIYNFITRKIFLESKEKQV